MRRILATAGVGLALLTASLTMAGCADQPQDEPTASPSPSKATTLVDKKTTCAAYLSLVADTSAKASPLIVKAQNAAQDPSAALSALVEFKTLIADYEAKLTPLAGNSSDTALKALLDTELAEVRQTKAEVDAAGVDPEKIQAALENQASSTASTNVKAACG